MRFSTGISGTPMPSFVKALTRKSAGISPTYIKSLATRDDPATRC